MPVSSVRTIDGHQLRLGTVEKPLYPGTGFTRGDVIAYYEAVAPFILPQLHNRVVTRILYPNGTGADRVYQRNVPKSAPEWIRRVTVSASPGTGKAAKQVTYLLVDNLAGLVWSANQAALELHTPQWHVGPRGGIGKPDRLVIDLDPGEGLDLDDVAAVARIVADRLRDDGYAPVPVTSGSKGIHLYAPLDGRKSSLAVHAMVRDLARDLAAGYPDRIVATAAKDERGGRVFLDWSQNHPARSTATPYSLRGKASPTVAAPRDWDEIGPGLAQLSPGEVLARLERDGDLLASSGLVN
jgi:bifunctional non-homologous end joining protein LigD